MDFAIDTDGQTVQMICDRIFEKLADR